LRQELEQQPTNVGVEKSFGYVVRIFVVIHMFMMAAMFACPHEDRILERSRAKDEREQPYRQSGPESHVRKQTVITERDAEAGRGQHHCKHRELEPVDTEIPQVQRHCRKCENNRADQERTRRPINVAGGNTENQGREFG